MTRSNKFDYQRVIENCLIAHPDGLTLDELLERSGLEIDRSTLFRHLTRIIEQGGAERIGKARASRYRPLGVAGTRENRGQAYAPRPAVEQLRPAENDRQVGADADSAPVLAPEHGAVVKKAVRRIVREWKRVDSRNLQIYLSLMLEPEHLDAVAEVVETELAGLHEGNLDRFELSPADLDGFVPPAGRAASGI